jgi:hypothetical protein
MTPKQAATIVGLLRDRPLFYRNFGPWWWGIKAQLKELGHTRDELQHLGDTDDERCHVFYEELTPHQVYMSALKHQHNATKLHYNGKRTDLPNGEDYYIHDNDVE